MGHKVSLWHVHNDDKSVEWVAKNDPDYPAIGGGSSAGMRAIPVKHRMGRRRFNVHGMDCCYRGAARHAGPHNGKPQARIDIVAPSGAKFVTSPQMVEEARYLCKMMFHWQIEVRLHGYGLVQEMVRMTMDAFGKAA